VGPDCCLTDWPGRVFGNAVRAAEATAPSLEEPFAGPRTERAGCVVRYVCEFNQSMNFSIGTAL